MKRVITLIIIFLATAVLYFGVSTRWTYTAKWYIDYFNPLAASLLHRRIDIDPHGQTYDLIQYNEKWYAPWGILSALFFIPFHLILGRYIPSIYISIFFGALNVCIVYLLLVRFKMEFFPKMNAWEIFSFLLLFAFGTMNFYVGTVGSSWHVDQIVTSFFGNAGILAIFKKERTRRDYFMSVALMGIALLGRGTIVFLSVIPAILFLWDMLVQKKKRFLDGFIVGIKVFLIPALLFSGWFFLYNWLRFGNPLEYGYAFIQESPYLAAFRHRYGSMSFHFLPINLWYMLFEIPAVRLGKTITLGVNLLGNSILYLTPPFLAALFAPPIFIEKGRWRMNPYIFSLWVGAIITMLPSLLIYSTGWMQFGYRYSLDITVVLLLLAVFGVKGKVNILMFFGILWATWMHVMGITALL